MWKESGYKTAADLIRKAYGMHSADLRMILDWLKLCRKRVRDWPDRKRHVCQATRRLERCLKIR
jgi:hypothetical protein